MIEDVSKIAIELKKINDTLANNYDWLTTSFSTLAGVFVGGYISYYFQNVGKLNIYLNDIEFLFSKSFDKIGFDTRNTKINEAPDNGQLFLDIDILNTKLVNENIREIELFILDKKKHKKLTLLDISTRRFVAQQNVYDEFKITNIPAKSVNNFKLKCHLNPETIELLLLNPSIYLTFKNQKNDWKKILLDKFKVDEIKYK